ncbi:MAG: hypothetical protein LUH58_02095 [Lachnospiraceae bacterium]|nr:hypothetical protein [Lachnospiraceae bacterium]
MREKKSETTSYVIEREFLSRCTSEEMLRCLIRTHLQKIEAPPHEVQRQVAPANKDAARGAGAPDETCKNELENVASCGTIATGTAVER